MASDRIVNNKFIVNHKGDNVRGSVMVEGAIYFPLVIICLAFTVLMFIHFYRITALSAHMHMVVRDEAGLRAGTTLLETQSSKKDKYRTEAESKRIKITTGEKYVRPYIEGTVSERYTGGRLTGGKKINRKYHARSYLANEKLLIRVKSIALD